MKHNAIIIYVPVVHQGYIDFLREHSSDRDIIILVDVPELLKEFPKEDAIEHLNRDLRALDSKMIARFLDDYFTVYDMSRSVDIATWVTLEESPYKYQEIIMPDDDISAFILEKIPELQSIVQLEKMFLRWDKNASLLEKEVNVPAISINEFHPSVVSELKFQIGRSVDWWRQVACVVFDDTGKIFLAAYNRHYPNDLALNIFGDPRFNFKPGEHIENCTAIHSEAWVIATAARVGIPLKDMHMLVSDFPCPVCAKSIAETEFKNLYFVRGYSKIDGQKTLEDRGIKIQKVLFE